MTQPHANLDAGRRAGADTDGPNSAIERLAPELWTVPRALCLRSPTRSSLPRFLAHILIRLVLAPLLPSIQVTAALFPISLLSPLVTPAEGREDARLSPPIARSAAVVAAPARCAAHGWPWAGERQAYLHDYDARTGPIACRTSPHPPAGHEYDSDTPLGPANATPWYDAARHPGRPTRRDSCGGGGARGPIPGESLAWGVRSIARTHEYDGANLPTPPATPNARPVGPRTPSWAVVRLVYDGTGPAPSRPFSLHDVAFRLGELQYDNGPGRARLDYDGGGTNLPSIFRSDEDPRWGSFDELQSIVPLTGGVAASYHLDPWDYVWDRETELYFAKARFFDPQFGRFISQDSYLGEINNPPSLHRYTYAHDNPTRYRDPDGHSATAIGAAAGFVWGFGQMIGGLANDAWTGQVRDTSDYLGLWAQNTIGGAEIGASIDVGLMSGGLALSGSGALGNAGAGAITFGGRGKDWSTFGADQGKDAAIGAALGPVAAKAAPVLGKVLGRIPGVTQGAEWLAGKAGQLAEKVGERFVVPEADAWITKPLGEQLTLAGAAAKEYLTDTVAPRLNPLNYRPDRTVAAMGLPVKYVGPTAQKGAAAAAGSFSELPVMSAADVQKALRAGGFEGDSKWAYSIHEHHIYPKWLGGKESGPLLRIRGFEHISDLEPALFEHVRSAIPEITSRSDAALVNNLVRRGTVPRSDITEALVDFYRSRYPTLDESGIRATLARGLAGKR